MNTQHSSKLPGYGLCLMACLLLPGCVGAVVGVVVDTTIEVVKVPFKVAGAAIDLAIPDDNEDE